MAGYLFADNARSLLAVGISASATSLNVSAGTGSLFPAPAAGQFFMLTLNDALTGLIYETVQVTAVSGDTLTVVRAQESSTARAWIAGDNLWNGPTAGSMSAMLQKFYANSTAGVESGVVTPFVADLNAAPLGMVNYYQSANSPVANGLGIVQTVSATGSSTPAANQFLYQFAQDGTNVLYYRQNINAGGWSAWFAIATQSYVRSLATGRLIGVQTFASAGTFAYIPSAGASRVIVEMVGGGGGGANCQATTTNENCSGGGGGAGGYVRYTGPATPQTITVGAGGAAQTSGGASSFGTAVSAGGGAGSYFPFFAQSSGGSGGTATGGNLVNANGGWGGDGQSTSVFLSPGNGAASHFGGGGRAGSEAGLPGAAAGSGGGGSYDSRLTGVPYYGGAGAAGLVLIYEYT